MKVHLVDGTYELFRYYFALPSHVTADGREVAAVRGVVGSVLSMIEEGVTHLGVATDHVIESFRNDLWPGYKTGAGVPPELMAQFPLLEEVLMAAGICTWPMVELEADDALGAAAKLAAADPDVEQVVICTPDKDLGQCVGGKVVQLDRRRQITLDADAVRAKFGVDPESIPDYLALVGDSADGFPGLKGGAPSRPPQSSPATATSRTSPPPRPTGTCGSPTPAASPPPCSGSSSTPSCSAPSPRSTSTRRW